MKGCDVFALPTGYGKCLIYAFYLVFLIYIKVSQTLPKSCVCFSLEQEGSIVICDSHLVSLMLAQRLMFTHKGITAEFVGKEQNDEDAIRSVLTGKVQLVYISPENLMCNPLF